MSPNNEKIIPATEARKNFFAILKNIQRPGIFYTITLAGKSCAVIMSSSEYNSWKETFEVASDTDLARDLKTAKNDFVMGNFVPLEDVLRAEGFLVADAPKEGYVPRSNQKKSKKRIR